MAESATETAESAPRSWKKLIVMAGILIPVLAGGFFTLRYLAVRKATAKPAEAKAEMKSILTLEPFLVNLADVENARLLKVTFRLGVADAKLGAELGGDQVALSAIRDSIISLLTSKKSGQILTPEGKDQLREQIRQRVNAILPKGEVGEVYIVDFVVQM